MPTYVGSTQASAIYKGSALLTDVYVGVVGGGAGYATGTLIETYESTSGFTPSAQTSMSLDTTLQLDALAGLSGASGIAEAYKLGVFTVSTNTTADIGLQVTQVNIDLDSDRQVGSLGVYFGKTSGAMAGALQSAPLPFGETWVASHVSENATLEGLTAGSFGIKPAAISGTSPYGGKVKFGATYIKVHARPTIAMVLDDCMAVQDAHIQAILDRGLVATRVIPSSFVGGGSNSSLATLLAQQAAGIALIPNATRNDQAVNTFGNRAAALAEMDASKAACAALGFNAEGLDYSVWPNGYFTDSATLKPATMTGDGTTTVTFSGVVTWVAGDRVMGPGVQRETDVISVAGDNLSAVLSKTVPIQTKPACATDISGEYARDKFLQDVKSSGSWKMIRATGGNNTFWPWFGPSELDFLMIKGASWTSGTFADAKLNVDRAVTRKSATMPYWHGDWVSGEMLQALDYIAAEKIAGRLDVLTVPQLGERCMDAVRP